MILVLVGGVGGAKLVVGLASALPPQALSVIVNTGDDSDHLGLHVSPDLDTVMYSLAGLSNTTLGWGLAGETWHFLDAVGRLGGETWFRLGDRDLATHVERTRRLKTESLSAITSSFCRHLGVLLPIIPMTDDLVQTMVETDEGVLAFHDYFVRRRCEPVFTGLTFAGIEKAEPSPGFTAALDDPALEAIVIGPSNPLLSILPILSLPGIREKLQRRKVPIVAVSPIIGGAAVKGPAAKIMREMGMEVSPAGVAAFYGDLLDGMVLDQADLALAGSLPAGLATLVTKTLMLETSDKQRLASETVTFARSLRPSPMR